MTFSNFMEKIKEAVLCCGRREKKHCLEISSPTNVRKGEWDLPGLTTEEREMIREKTTMNTHRFQSLTSHPPTRLCSNPTSLPPSLSSSREPSVALLNSASINLPTCLPTPPRQKHTDSNPPSSAHNRMKGFWDRTRRLSNTLSTHSHSGYQGLGKDEGEAEGENNESVVMLNLDFKENELDSPVSGKSLEDGSDVQDIVSSDVKASSEISIEDRKHSDDVIVQAIRETEGGDSSASDSEVDDSVAKPLVNA